MHASKMVIKQEMNEYPRVASLNTRKNARAKLRAIGDTCDCCLDSRGNRERRNH